MAPIDVLMIKYKRPEYLAKAIAGIEAQTVPVNLILWDNEEKNESLADITSRVFLNSKADFVGKVDSDTIVPPDWAERLLDAHSKHHFGFIGGFHFRPEDLEGLKPNIEDFNGVKIWRKHHIGGCAFIIRREDFKGYTGKGVMGLSEYQAEMGFPNGYLWDPILYVEHMEDLRSKHVITNDEYRKYKLKTRGITLEQYQSSFWNESYMKENTL